SEGVGQIDQARVVSARERTTPSLRPPAIHSPTRPLAHWPRRQLSGGGNHLPARSPLRGLTPRPRDFVLIPSWGRGSGLGRTTPLAPLSLTSCPLLQEGSGTAYQKPVAPNPLPHYSLLSDKHPPKGSRQTSHLPSFEAPDPSSLSRAPRVGPPATAPPAATSCASAGRPPSAFASRTCFPAPVRRPCTPAKRPPRTTAAPASAKRKTSSSFTCRAGRATSTCGTRRTMFRRRTSRSSMRSRPGPSASSSARRCPSSRW